MTGHTITEEDRKIGMKMLGEEYLIIPYGSSFKLNRTFTTRTDRDDLFEKLVELGKWWDFYYYVLPVYANTEKQFGGVKIQDFVVWLFIDSPARACWLVIKFWKEDKK